MPVGTAVDLILGSMLDRRNRLDPADPTSKTPNFQTAACVWRCRQGGPVATGFAAIKCGGPLEISVLLGYPPRRVKAQILSGEMRFGAHQKSRTISTKASGGRAHG
jgi:hypothetical protein